MQKDSVKTITAAVLLSVIGILVLLSSPVFIRTIVNESGFSVALANQLISLELFGVALASMLAVFWIRRMNWRGVSVMAVLVVAGGNLLSSQLTSFATLAPLRFLTGFLGEGIAFAVAIAMISDTEKKERNFALSIGAQMAAGVIALLTLPRLAEQWGLAGILIPLALLALAILPSTWLWVPAMGAPRAAVQQRSGFAAVRLALLAISVMIIWCTGLGAVWHNLVLIGQAAGVENAPRALAFSTFVAITGPVAASFLSDRWGRIIPVTAALAIQAIMITALQGDMSWWQFAATVAIFQIFWNFNGPYVTGTIAASDTTGRISVLIPASQIAGFALGPAIVGMLTQSEILPVHTAARHVGVACFVLALVIFLPTALRQSRQT